MSLFNELKRRKVFRVAAVYAATAFVVLQAADLLVEALGVPSWVLTATAILTIVGFPLALVIGWAFEVSPQGVRRADDERPIADAGSAGSTPLLGRVTIAVVSGLLLVGIGLGAGWFLGSDVIGSGPADASIAVLPFDNLGDPESDYLAAGLHGDVLTQLYKIGALRVISRTSVLGYRPGEHNAREVAEELGVSTILEGTVRHDPANNRIRLVVQLIDAEADEPIWADQFDRTLDDVFEIQNELALNIARELRTTLQPAETQRIAERSRPTTEAWDLILRGRELYALDVERNQAALRYFRQATEADPTSAEAWAELSNALGQHLQLGTGSSADRDSQLVYAERAVALDSDLPLAYRALGFAHSTAARASATEAAYSRALELSPNYTLPMVNLSGRRWNRGECAEGMRLAARAHELSPLDPFPAGHLGDHNACIGRWNEVVRWFSVARSIEPSWIWADFFQALYGLGFGLDAESAQTAERFLARAPSEPTALLVSAEVAVLLGQCDAAGEYSSRLLKLTPPDWYFMRGHALAIATRDYCRMILGERIDDRDLQAAIEGAERRMDASGDAPYATKALPILHAVAGDAGAAIDWLERAARLSGASQIGRYERDPRLESIRDDPRFTAAMDEARGRIARERAAIEEWEASAAPFARDDSP